MIMMGKGLKVLFWNIRSIYNKIDSVRYEIDKLQPDIININETWLNDNISDDEIDISGYNLMRHDRGRDEHGIIKRGGGLSTYIKTGLICNNMPEFAISKNNIELSVFCFFCFFYYVSFLQTIKFYSKFFQESFIASSSRKYLLSINFLTQETYMF